MDGRDGLMGRASNPPIQFPPFPIPSIPAIPETGISGMELAGARIMVAKVKPLEETP
jgi:hypothetical protein